MDSEYVGNPNYVKVRRDECRDIRLSKDYLFIYTLVASGVNRIITRAQGDEERMSISLNVYLVTDGNGREAVDFYQKAFGAEVLALQTFGDGPSDPNHPIPPEAKDRIMHASLQIGSSVLMLSDTFPGMPYTVGNHVTVTVNTDTADEAKAIFNQLQDGGEVKMPIQETFWSPAYGSVVDKFGIQFQISATPGQA